MSRFRSNGYSASHFGLAPTYNSLLQNGYSSAYHHPAAAATAAASTYNAAAAAAAGYGCLNYAAAANSAFSSGDAAAAAAGFGLSSVLGSTGTPTTRFATRQSHVNMT